MATNTSKVVCHIQTRPTKCIHSEHTDLNLEENTTKWYSHYVKPLQELSKEPVREFFNQKFERKDV